MKYGNCRDKGKKKGVRQDRAEVPFGPLSGKMNVIVSPTGGAI